MILEKQVGDGWLFNRQDHPAGPEKRHSYTISPLPCSLAMKLQQEWWMLAHLQLFVALPLKDAQRNLQLGRDCCLIIYILVIEPTSCFIDSILNVSGYIVCACNISHRSVKTCWHLEASIDRGFCVSKFEHMGFILLLKVLHS